MKTFLSIIFLITSLSTFAQAVDIHHWTFRAHLDNACNSGDIEKLNSYLELGYDPSKHIVSWTGVFEQPIDSIRETQRHNFILLGSESYGPTEPDFEVDFENIKKCYRWFDSFGALPDVNIKIKENVTGIVSYFNLPYLAAEMSSGQPGDKAEEKVTMLWLEFFVQEYGYETQNEYPITDGSFGCELSLAVQNEFSLANIKKIVALGFKTDGRCLDRAIERATTWKRWKILNYLKTL